MTSNKTSLESQLLFTCRICLEQSRLTNLISPCKCKGTMKHIHKSCFIRWINKSRSLICELCHSNYRNLIIRSKSVSFLDFIKKEPEWLVSFIINSVPIIYDLYFIMNHSELNFNRVAQSPIVNLNRELNSIGTPITIQLNSVNVSLFLTFNRMSIDLKTIPITFPIEILNMIFYLRDLYFRFKQFKLTNLYFDIDFF